MGIDRRIMSYFTDALANFTTEVAYKEAIRKLYKQGFSNDEIKKACTYPVTDAMIAHTIDEYEQKLKSPASEYVEDYDKFGRKTLRKKFH